MSEPNALDRILSDVRKIIRAEFPNLTYLGSWEYSVTGVNADGTVNCTAPAGTSLPNLNNVAVRSGPEGGTSTPTVGNTCTVRFMNADPTRPAIVGNGALVRVATIDATEQVNVGPSAETVVLAGGSAPVARNADAVAVYFGTFPVGLQITGNFRVGSPTTAGSFDGTITFVEPAQGLITSGQPRVLA